MEIPFVFSVNFIFEALQGLACSFLFSLLLRGALSLPHLFFVNDKDGRED
jgi:hypothetical protein